MITEYQKTEACILLNKLKILITEAATLKDLKDLYTTIEGGIDGAVTAAISAAAASSSSGSSGSSSSTGGSAPVSTPTPAPTPEPFVGISTTWYTSKIQKLKTEINKVLQEITTQIRNNI